MVETSRLLEAASALSQTLAGQGIAHAFHGSIVVAVLANSPQCNEILCIVDGGTVHPFRIVRQAVEGHEFLTATNQPWTNRLHVTYHRPIPPIIIEILPAGEEGPRHLDGNTTVRINGLPFLIVTEFLRAKLNSWSLRGLEHDAHDIIWTLTQYWQRVDINRIPEVDMERLILQYPSAASAWTAVKNRFS